MRHQIAHRDRTRPTLELRKILGYRIVEAHAALLEQLHHAARGRDDFGKRGDVENRIRGHRLFGRLESAVAVSLAEDNLPVVPDLYDSAGNFVFANGLIDYGVEIGRPRETLGGGSRAANRRQ